MQEIKDNFRKRLVDSHGVSKLIDLKTEWYSYESKRGGKDYVTAQRFIRDLLNVGFSQIEIRSMINVGATRIDNLRRNLGDSPSLKRMKKPLIKEDIDNFINSYRHWNIEINANRGNLKNNAYPRYKSKMVHHNKRVISYSKWIKLVDEHFPELKSAQIIQLSRSSMNNNNCENRYYNFTSNIHSDKDICYNDEDNPVIYDF